MPKFVSRERKHRKLAKQRTSQQIDSTSSNAEVVVPLTQSEKEEKRHRLQEELKAQQPDARISGKKKKRLDKYIDTKLKKEENLELLKKLAAQKVDTSLLQSAKKLGRVQETKRERLSRALQEQAAGIDIEGTRDAILFEKRGEPVQHEDSGHGDATGGPSGDAIGDPTANATEDAAQDTRENAPLGSAIPAVPPALRSAQTVPAGFGAGLKRPLEVDESGQPVIKKRKRQKKAIVAFEPVEPDPADNASVASEEFSEDEWNGFSEDDSASVGSSITSDDVSSDSSAEESDIDSDDSAIDNKGRLSAFKAWADSQRNQALDFTPSTVHVNDDVFRADFKPRAPSPDAALQDAARAAKQSESAYRPEKAVVIPRAEDLQAARTQLPVVQEEQRIMEAIHNNLVTVVCGATGSGKTTQLPQMLLENGYTAKGIIGVTQPRRVAAQSVANRVSHELGTEYGKQVGSQVRYDSNIGRDTKIKFMTDGILLREIGQDFALNKYSVVVIDEAHERSVNTDILIGMLSRIVPIRQTLSQEQPDKYHPLKLVIMSATLRVTDFVLNEKLFKSDKPPIVEAEGRQYPVTEHFARKTHRDYVTETVRKVSRGHRKLPAGSILVFLTGQDEITTVAKKLKEDLMGVDALFANSRKPFQKIAEQPANDYLEDDEERRVDSDDEADIIGLDDDADDAEFEDVEADPNSHLPRGGMKAHILPLYGTLSSEQQMRVFQPAPEGNRLIVLATNVAETSLTIPGVRFVFDCGRSKEKHYDIDTGVQEFKIDWISKASASQRMGRAGRTGPGHCYRLYSSAIYEQYFEEHTVPEILRTPIEGTVLQLKAMNVDNVVKFPFPTPPQREQLAQAEGLLKNLGAIDSRSGKITAQGHELQNYPVNPRFGKMLQHGLKLDVLPYTIALVAGLAVGELFIPETQVVPKREEHDDDDDGELGSRRVDSAADAVINSRKQAFGRAHATFANFDDKSDAIKLLTAIAAHADAESKGDKTFCSQYFLREKGMAEVQQLRSQLHNIMNNQLIKRGQPPVPYRATLDLPKDKQIAALKQIVAAGYIDQVAVRADRLPTATSTGQKARRAIEVPYRTLLSSVAESDIDRTTTLEEQAQQRSVYVHPSSVLAKLSVHEMPDYIIYSTLSRAAASTVDGKQKRTRMHPLATAWPKLLATLAEKTPLLEVGKPIGRIEEKQGKRECWVSVSLKDPNAAGTTGWSLPAWKVLQSRKGKGWVIDKVLSR